MADDDTRYIQPGACSWCGHAPHDATCGSTIKTRTSAKAPCPCILPLRLLDGGQ